MAAPEPTVRYFDASTPTPRRWALVGILTALVVVGIGAVVWFTTDWIDDGGAAAGSVAAGNLPEGATGPGDSGGDRDADDDGDGDDPSDAGAAAGATSVVVVGDSITQGSAAAIEYTLAAHGFTDITVDGLTSRRIEAGGGGNPESGVQAISRLLAEGADPDVWVVALGTNDIGKYSTPEEYAALVRVIVDLLPDDRPLVWVDTYRDDYVDETRVLNETLTATLGARDGTVVTSWYDVVVDDPSILRDGVHPDRDGQASFASVVADGLDRLR